MEKRIFYRRRHGDEVLAALLSVLPGGVRDSNCGSERGEAEPGCRQLRFLHTTVAGRAFCRLE
jgi:hypothetical protein